MSVYYGYIAKDSDLILFENVQDKHAVDQT